VIVKLENQSQFDKIYEYCQLIFDKKLKLLTKFNLYCQTKVVHTICQIQYQKFDQKSRK